VISPKVFTIPPHRAFSDALVAGVMASRGGDPLVLARGTILVPNNRAARAISDAFVRRTGTGLLLPRLVPIGDAELDDRIGGAFDPAGLADPVPPAVAPMLRQMLLARLVQRHLPGALGAAEAMRLAADLGRTLDALLIEEVNPSRLADAAADAPELSHHWQVSLNRLQLILDAWPAALARIGCIDLAERRNRLLNALARRWRAAPPPGFVVAAGITSTAPAIANLLAAVARLEAGQVVVPGLDLDMDSGEWDALGPHDPDPDTGRRSSSIETHPQYHLKLLLDRMSVGRLEVTRWHWGGGHDAPAVRTRAIANAMAPARHTGKWQTLPPRERRLTGVRAVEAANPAEEAQLIAIALRGALEEPEQTAALVTPDRNLARRVQANLRRWGIEADDSAGRPLAATSPGTLLLGLAAAAAERFAPIALVALLKHPLVMAGEGRLPWLDGARALDLALRGPRPPAGLAGIDAHLADQSGRDGRTRAAAANWWRESRMLLEPLERAFEASQKEGDQNESSLSSLLAALRETATALCGDASWSGAAGRMAAELIEAAESAAPHGPANVSSEGFVPLLAGLLAQREVRPPYGGHPRIFIWGLLEARLQRADLMILAGLNEGSWPQLPQPDAWLAPRIRANLGLPGLERRVGLSAHDFASALGGPRVLVTRARRDARAPAIASRFWLRLEAMTGGMTRVPRLLAAARNIDQPGHAPRPAARPAPSPPADQRPLRISVTEVDTLKADPFAFYARSILRLSSLDALDADPGPAWRGTAVHAVLEAWMKHDDCTPQSLRPRAEALLDAAHPLLRTLWRPRLLEAVDWMAGKIAENRLEGRQPHKAEVEGKTEIAGIRLRGRADRIDLAPDGSLVIVDYKTGQPPTGKQVAAGFALQLGLLGLLAERNSFGEVAGVAGGFEYWSLARGKDKTLGFVKSPLKDEEPSDFVTRAERDFVAAAARWLTGDDPFTAKLRPDFAPYPEYNQLMRFDEWYGRGL